MPLTLAACPLLRTYTLLFAWRTHVLYIQVFLRCFRDPIRVPRIREIGPLQIHTGCLTFSLKKKTLVYISFLSFVPATQQLISSPDNKSRSSALWAGNRENAEWVGNNITKLRTYIPDTYPPGKALTAWVRLNHFRAGVGRFRCCPHKWGMASSAVCACGAEDQTVDHVVLPCPIHRPPHGLHGRRF